MYWLLTRILKIIVIKSINYIIALLVYLHESCISILGNLEVFHNLILKFAPKRLHFSKETMVARTRLAALEHNENTGRTKAVTNEGIFR